MARRAIGRLAAMGVALLLFNSTPAAAGDGATRDNSLQPGSWAVQFQIADDIGLKPFNGMAISVKRHTSRQSAFRFAANLKLDSNDNDRDNARFQADTLYYTSSYHEESNKQGVQLDALYLRYTNPDARANWFVGAGPLVRFDRQHSKTRRTGESSYGMEVTTWDGTSHTWSVGVLALAGIEWFG